MNFTSKLMYAALLFAGVQMKAMDVDTSDIAASTVALCDTIEVAQAVEVAQADEAVKTTAQTILAAVKSTAAKGVSAVQDHSTAAAVATGTVVIAGVEYVGYKVNGKGFLVPVVKNNPKTAAAVTTTAAAAGAAYQLGHLNKDSLTAVAAKLGVAKDAVIELAQNHPYGAGAVGIVTVAGGTTYVVYKTGVLVPVANFIKAHKKAAIIVTASAASVAGAYKLVQHLNLVDTAKNWFANVNMPKPSLETLKAYCPELSLKNAGITAAGVAVVYGAKKLYDAAKAPQAFASVQARATTATQAVRSAASTARASVVSASSTVANKVRHPLGGNSQLAAEKAAIEAMPNQTPQERGVRKAAIRAFQKKYNVTF